MNHLRKLSWQQFCIDLELFHLERVANTHALVLQGKASKEWSIRDTAAEIGRSLGKVSEDLRLAEGLRIWPSLENSPNRASALVLLFKKIEERERRQKERVKELDKAVQEAVSWKPKINPLDELI